MSVNRLAIQISDQPFGTSLPRPNQSKRSEDKMFDEAIVQAVGRPRRADSSESQDVDRGRSHNDSKRADHSPEPESDRDTVNNETQSDQVAEQPDEGAVTDDNQPTSGVEANLPEDRPDTQEGVDDQDGVVAVIPFSFENLTFTKLDPVAPLTDADLLAGRSDGQAAPLTPALFSQSGQQATSDQQQPGLSATIPLLRLSGAPSSPEGVSPEQQGVLFLAEDGDTAGGERTPELPTLSLARTAEDGKVGDGAAPDSAAQNERAALRLVAADTSEAIPSTHRRAQGVTRPSESTPQVQQVDAPPPFATATHNAPVFEPGSTTGATEPATPAPEATLPAAQPQRPNTGAPSASLTLPEAVSTSPSTPASPDAAPSPISPASPANPEPPAPAPAALLRAPEIESLDSEALVARVARGLQSAAKQHGGQVTLRLHPPDLGFMRVSLQVNEGVVRAELTTGNEGVRSLLQQQLGQLRHALESQGLSVERLQVQTASPSNDANNQTGDHARQAPQDGRSRGEYAQTHHGRDGRDQAQQQAQEEENAFDELVDTKA